MSNRNTMPVTYDELVKFVDGRASRTLCNNTVAINRLADDGYIAIRLHGHTICEVYPSWLVISDAGYVTTTTYDRLKRFVAPLGAAVHRRHGQGYVTLHNGAQFPITWVGVAVF